MAKYFAGGHLRYLEGEWRDDNGDVVDIKEVRHGHWIDTGTFDSHYTPIYQCSECWKEVADNYIKYHKYCLHCGAQMDKEN